VGAGFVDGEICRRAGFCERFLLSLFFLIAFAGLPLISLVLRAWSRGSSHGFIFMSSLARIISGDVFILFFGHRIE
jgi:hypothetical protein